MATRSDMLKKLQSTTKEYVDKERTRLQNEAQVLTSVLKGRTGGKGIQATSNAVVSSVAYGNLAAYLSGSGS